MAKGSTIGKAAAFGATAVASFFIIRYFLKDRPVGQLPVDEEQAQLTWNPDEGEWFIEYGWTPDDLAARLYNEMEGTVMPWDMSMGWTDRAQVWYDLGNKDPEGIKWVHNFWLQNIDKDQSVYDWIFAEEVLPGSIEEGTKDYAMQRLISVGAVEYHD